MRILVVTIAIATYACAPVSQAGVPEYTFEVVHSYPHDRTAFTEGLFYLDGFLYESTGIEGASSVRKVRLETGEVVQRHDLPSAYFGEGIIQWKDRLIQLTYKTEVGFVYNLSTFETERRFEYPGEGWAMTQDGKNIFMSDGTAQIRIWDPETLQELRRITVTDQGQPVPNVNELESVKGEIYANIWETDRIARIDPATGRVVGWIDLAGLLSPNERLAGPEGTDVLNGIAYDAKGNRLFVTGKRWPKLFEIRLVRRSPE
jgi:glutamine cyclotransferase